MMPLFQFQWPTAFTALLVWRAAGFAGIMGRQVYNRKVAAALVHSLLLLLGSGRVL